MNAIQFHKIKGCIAVNNGLIFFVLVAAFMKCIAVAVKTTFQLVLKPLEAAFEKKRSFASLQKNGSYLLLLQHRVKCL